MNIDDGYSGTTFDRPGFQRLIGDIKAKRINLVIVKDLSRLGRDHILTGYYVETFFPENGIRFISMLEGYDNAINQASNDSATWLFACNDYYSKQNSIKIRNVLNDKRRNGKFIGSAPSFGYLRDPEDKGHLIPDPEYAWVISEEMYLRISRETENSLARTREKIQCLQDTKDNKKVNKLELKDYENKIRELIDIDNPSRELIQLL